jgi:ABC-2 type transport system ATP-binding protein
MIEFVDVRKSYGTVQAVDGVSFQIRRGEVFGFIGPNGAGKTTSIKILTGMIRAYEGSVLIEGTPLEDERASFHRRVGYLPQTAGFQEWRTVRHALTTFGRLSGLVHPDLDRRIAAVSRRLGLSESLDRKIVHLSGGMQQRLRFAQAILHEPEVVILDEPLSGLDPSSRAELKRTIRELASEDHTIVLTSHVLSDVEDLATRIAIIDRGSIRDSGTREELRDRHNVAMLVEILGTAIHGHTDAFATLAAVARVVPIGTGASKDGPGARLERLILEIEPHAVIDDALHEIMQTIVSRRVPVRSVRHLQPSLEDVYLSLTEASRE